MLNIQKNFNLRRFNTLAVPSQSDFFCEVTSRDELYEAVAYARTQSLKFFILAGGSNTLLPELLSGLVIYINIKGIKKKIEGESVYIRAGAGENWHNFVQYCLSEKSYGLENLSLIPGSVGATPIQNIGAYGVEIKDLCSKVFALNLETMDEEIFSNSQCQFSYRESIFKKSAYKSKYVILAVEFKLSTRFSPNLEYPALKSIVEQKLGGEDKALLPETLAQVVIDMRNSKLPHPSEIPNVGSFFKNPIVGKSLFVELQKTYPEIPSFSLATDDGREPDMLKIPAAWLIDQCEWKGRYLNKVGVHKHQALVIVNPEYQNISSVLELAENIKKDVLNKFSIELQVEPQKLHERS